MECITALRLTGLLVKNVHKNHQCMAGCYFSFIAGYLSLSRSPLAELNAYFLIYLSCQSYVGECIYAPSFYKVYLQFEGRFCLSRFGFIVLTSSTVIFFPCNFARWPKPRFVKNLSLVWLF